MALLSLLQVHASADREYRIDRQYAKRDNPRYGTGLVEPGIMGPPADQMGLATYEQVIELHDAIRKIVSRDINRQ